MPSEQFRNGPNLNPNTFHGAYDWVWTVRTIFFVPPTAPLKPWMPAGFPRVYEIVRDLISHVDGRVDEGNLRTVVTSYQRVCALTLGELWAIPIRLRLALIENLARIAADVWAERMLETARRDPKNIILDIADMARAGVPMSSAFIAEMARKLQSHNPAVALALTWIEQRLTEQGQTIERHVNIDSQRQATNHIAIGNSITSLRFLTSIDWKDFVEALSRVENILREDPAGIYPKMDFATRGRYRHAIESMAKKSAASEESVAMKVIARAQSARGGDKWAHIGTYLIDCGKPELERDLGIRLTLGIAAGHVGRKMPLALYGGAILLVTAGLTALSLSEITGAGIAMSWVMGTLLFLGRDAVYHVLPFYGWGEYHKKIQAAFAAAPRLSGHDHYPLFAGLSRYRFWYGYFCFNPGTPWGYRLAYFRD
jgi:hypothetical protein